MLVRPRNPYRLVRCAAMVIVVSFGLLAITGTGGGGGGGGGAAGPVAIEGIWRGSKTRTVYLCIIFICTPDHKVSSRASALASKSGKIHLLPWDVVNSSGPGGLVSQNFAGSVQVSGSAVTGTIRGTCDPLDGAPVFGHIFVDGSVASGVALDLDYSLDECIGSGTFNLDFYKASEKSATLDRIKGQWSSGTVTLNVDKEGSYTGATGAGCQLSGSMRPASSKVNIYDANVSLENCGFINGAYSGLAGVFPDRSDIETLVISASGNGRTISIVVKR